MIRLAVASAGFGLRLAADLEAQGSFSTFADYTRTPINALGGEWKTSITIGGDDSLSMELFQPLDYHGTFFVLPRASVIRGKEESGIGLLEVEALQSSVELGFQIRNWGQLSWGVTRGRLDSRLKTVVGLEEQEIDLGGFLARAQFDLLDDPFFPRSGWIGDARLLLSRRAMSADHGASLGSKLPPYSQFAVGGFLNLSGIDPAR